VSLGRPSRLVGAALCVGGLLLVAGCGPIPVGLTAVTQRDGHLLIAVMRCDDTALERVGVDHPGPLRGTDTPREHVDDGRWTTDQDEDDIIVLDTSDPGEGWDTETSLGTLDPSVRYTASGGGDSDHPMGHVGFTTAELEALAEGQWLYDSGETRDPGAAGPTTTDLADLREEECHA